MADFTYNIPDERKFFAAVQQILLKSSNSKENILADKLKGGKCSIVSTSQFSRERWDAYSTGVHFYVSVDNMDFFDKDANKILLTICGRVMPKEAGYDIQNIEIAPILDDISIDTTLTSDLDYIQSSVSNKSFQLLPDDIKDKGKEMSEVYIYLYCVENSLRLFIDKVFICKVGNNYFTKIAIPTAVKKSIQVRKELEQKNQWIGIRGDVDLFYLDFKELSNIIITNWDLFKEYFPDQHWLNVKIDELGNCRNLIAHNSYVGLLEREVIRLNYNQILKQITLVETKKETATAKSKEVDDFPF